MSTISNLKMRENCLGDIEYTFPQLKFFVKNVLIIWNINFINFMNLDLRSWDEQSNKVLIQEPGYLILTPMLHHWARWTICNSVFKFCTFLSFIFFSFSFWPGTHEGAHERDSSVFCEYILYQRNKSARY